MTVTSNHSELIKPNHSVSFFDVGDHVIRVEASYLSGRERVYVDDQLISQKLTWRMQSEHSFELDGQAIVVRIKVESLGKGPVSVTLLVDGKEVDSDVWSLKRILTTNPKHQTAWQVLLLLLLFGLIGVAAGYLIGAMLATGLKG